MPSTFRQTLQPDDALQQSAAFRFNPADRAALDEQIRACQTFLAALALNGLHGTYATTATNLAVGDVVCLAGATTGTVTLALAAPLLAAGRALGVVLEAASAGAKVAFALFGAVSPSLTGLAAGASGAVRVSSAGRCERVGTIGVGDFAVGTVDDAGWLSMGTGVVGDVTASSTPTALTIAMWDASKNMAAAKFNGEGTTSTAGILNTTKNVTQVAAKNNGGSADLSLVSTTAADKTIFGDVTNGASADLIAKTAGFVREMVGTFVALHSTANGTSFGMAPDFGGGVGMLGLANATTEPTTAPSGGIDFYSFAGAFKAWSPKVLRTTIAAETNGAATDQRIDRIHKQMNTGDAVETPIFTWALPNLASQAVFDVLISGMDEGSDARVSFHIYVSVSRNAGNAAVDGTATIITIVDTITVAGVPTVDVTGTSARFNVKGKTATNIIWRISGMVDYFCP